MSDTEMIRIEGMDEETAQIMCGPQDNNLKSLSECAERMISYRTECFIVQDCSMDLKERLEHVLHALYAVASKGRAISEQDVIYAWRRTEANEEVDFNELGSLIAGRTLAGKVIAPKTHGQYEFIKAMDENAIVFAIGPAGTGKTYLAVIKAVSALKKGDVKRIVLTRPAVEAGENLGFLPGDLKEKVDPYLTPLYDALHVMLGNERTEALIEKGTIEIAPLAYMRGRTLDDAYVILDEAQNTTASQMKMFLTRLGFRSRMVITGDITQIDLDHRTTSGLVEAVRILEGVPDIRILRMSSDDVVRHPLVQKIIERYEKDSAKHQQK